MDSEYEIIDNRLPETLRKLTFSGYKKTDVYNILFLSIENGKIENACNWLTECICSGYILELWEKLLNFSCNVVSINNPKLFHHLYKKNNLLHNVLKCVDKNDRYGLLECRNNIVIRNLYFSIVTILSMSDKKVRYDKYPKLRDSDFDFENIYKRFTANVFLLPNDFIKFNEPEELKLVMNEIYTYLKNRNYEMCIYWTFWIFEWEKRNIKAKNSWHIDVRDVDVLPKFKADLVWVLWELILLEKENKCNDTKIQIRSLYELYKHDFTSRKRNKRLPYLYMSMCMLTNDVDYNIPLIRDNILYIQANIKNGEMFKMRKPRENHDVIKDIEVDKKLLSGTKYDDKMNKETTEAKIKLFNDLDSFNK